MVDSLQIPNDVAKTVDITVKDTSEVLRRFLVDMTIRINSLEARIKALENP